ncbi:MAG: hypothetical protein FWF00_07095 [Endomicrobia bacterium]|nr:hypothetical protein [Endomicrobiia bacterium]MCL2507432.1 hypothetical protein [Endomicrobiia bacterium]
MESLKVRFPALDVSVADWNRDNKKENAPEIYLKDEYFHHNEESFNKYMAGHLIVDSDGNIFKITGIEKLHNLSEILPFTAKYKLVFEPENRIMTFEEVKSYMLEKICPVKDKFDDYKSDWVKSVESAKTIEDLILT